MQVHLENKREKKNTMQTSIHFSIATVLIHLHVERDKGTDKGSGRRLTKLATAGEHYLQVMSLRLTL